jgi:AcrR family transcriptional regulator
MRPKDELKIDLFFQSTLDLVAQVGLAGLTMPMIAKRSGVGAGTIYLYFEGKEDLILTLFNDIKDRFGNAIFDGYDPKMATEKGFGIIWGNALRYATEHYAEQIFLQQFNNSPYRKARETAEYAENLMQPLIELIARGQREGTLKADKDQLIPQLFFGFLMQIAVGLHESQNRLTKKFIDKTFRFFWDAVST